MARRFARSESGFPMAPVVPRSVRLGYYEAKAVEDAYCAVAVDPEVHVPSRRFRLMLDFELAPSRMLLDPDADARARELPPCPICAQGFLRTHLTRSCPGCSRAHHLGCWDARAGCGLCDPPQRRLPRVEPIQSQPSPPRYSVREWFAITFLLKTIAASVCWTLVHV